MRHSCAKRLGSGSVRRLKLVIQIPAFNEEQTLGIALRALPKSVEGFDCVEILVIDDGSNDRTVAVALDAGADYVLKLGDHRGLGVAFSAGLEAALARGADVIVNTDADNQYFADDIARLVAPIHQGRAEIVVGVRPIARISHFSPVKKALQFLGSYIVRSLSGTDIADCASGFRALTRDAAARLELRGSYTHTLETIVRAGQLRIPITSVPVRVNDPLRPSRLIKSLPEYLARQAMAALRAYGRRLTESL